MTLRALITRPEEDAAPLAAALNQRGIETTIESLLSIRTLTEAALDLSGVQAILFTSANGVRAFAELAAAKGAAGWRELPAFAVGDATARTARVAGFAQVASAAGNVDSLAELVAAKLDPQKGALFHAVGSAVAGDLAGSLGGRGFDVRRTMIYEARPAESLSAATLDALRQGAFDLILFFSPRTAATFAALTQAAGDKAVEGCRRATALCLSSAVAGAVTALPFRAVESADHPDLPSMLQLVEKVTGTMGPAAEPEKIIDVTPSATAPKAPPAWAPSPASRTSWLAAVAVAAIVGAVVAAAVSLLLQPEPQALSADVNAAIEEKLTAAEKGMIDLGARVAAAEGSADAVKTEIAKVASDLATLRTDMTSMAAGTGDAGDTASQLAEITNRLAAAEEKLKSLALPTGEGVEGDTAVRLSAENIQMKKDLAGLRDELSKTVAENNRLTTRLTDVESRLQDNSAAAAQAAFTLAVANLNKTLATSQPFAAPLAALKEIAGRDSALSDKVSQATESIAPFGARGVPTLTGLTASFPATADGIARAVTKTAASESAAAEQGFLGKTWDRIAEGMSDAVTVRPEGEAEGDGPLERLARAELRLAESKLADAVAELDGLSGAAREAATPWLEQAKARLAVDAAMETLSGMALVGLPGSLGAGG